MSATSKCVASLLLILAVGRHGGAQVYSPKVLLQGQVDSSSLASLAKGICANANAVTPRQKAEAIWRFFLTDGRFVPPGFWYHIAGWAYEEPEGEVLDAMKLLNSYGFGLCYHIAPLLEAVYEAAGFEDARVWFLTGHSVTEVYYDGAYHHFDSDMLGYNPVGSGDPKKLPVASVSQIALDGSIMLGKLLSPKVVDKSKVDYPWYPADLQEAAIGDLAELFTSTKDNWLYPYTRYSQGHTMDFELRRGERLIRYFQPESGDTFYLPYEFDGKRWHEFPREIAQYAIRTEDGPKSQRDSREWATGRIEYNPVLSSKAAYYPAWKQGFNQNLLLPDPGRGRDYLSPADAGQPAEAVFEIRSPYVLIDAAVSIQATLKDSTQSLRAEISVDGGRNWEVMGEVRGPLRTLWRAEPAPVLRSQHGKLTTASGRYGYLVRVTMAGAGQADSIQLRGIGIKSRFQLSPRTLPALAAGRNNLQYRPGVALQRWSLPVKINRLSEFASRAAGVKYVSEDGQEILWPEDGQTAEVIFEVAAPDGSPLSGFDAGARFLDLRDGLAPDKLTAETRKTGLGGDSGRQTGDPEASLSWSDSLTGKYNVLWRYDPQPRWLDGKPASQLLRWPEVDRHVKDVPEGTRKIYVRYRFRRMGLDSIRLAALSAPRPEGGGVLEIVHQWDADGVKREHRELITRPDRARDYIVETGPGRKIVNSALILSCPP